MIALLVQGASSMDHCDSRRVKLHLLGYVHPCPDRALESGTVRHQKNYERT